MVTIQSGRGRIELFDDFMGAESIVANTAATESLGPFRVVGVGFNGSDAGIVLGESDPNLNGVAILTASASAGDVTALVTAKCFDVSLMATLVV